MKKNIKKLTEEFWALSRKRQESFLKEIYDLTPQNKELFQVRLGKDYQMVLDAMKKDIQKQTINRIGKFKRIKLSNINTILKNAEKYGLTMHQQIELRRETWVGILAFVQKQKWRTEPYQKAGARHLDTYLSMVDHHVLERSERDEIYEKEKQFLEEIFSVSYHLPHVEDIYMKYFTPKK